MPNSNLGDLELSCLSHNSSDNNRLSLFLVIWLLGMWGGKDWEDLCYQTAIQQQGNAPFVAYGEGAENKESSHSKTCSITQLVYFCLPLSDNESGAGIGEL